MPRNFNIEQPHFWIFLRAEEENLPLLHDINTFLHDFNLVYELSRVATDPNYDFSLQELKYYREEVLNIHIRNEDRLHVERMSMQSPLELSVVVVAVPAAIGAIWGLVQVVEKVVNFRLNRRKLKEEVAKLIRENERQSSESVKQNDSTFLFENPRFLEAQLESTGTLRDYRIISERLVQSKVEIVEVVIELRNIESRDIDNRYNS